jgi:hypothetical protein
MSLSLSVQTVEFHFELSLFYRPNQAAQRAEQLGLRSYKQTAMGEKQLKVSSNSVNPNLPSIDVSYIQLQISHVRWAKFYLYLTYL